MEFFGMGPLEILLILIVALIAFGPGRLPDLARNIGKGIRAFRKATLDLTAEVTKEFKEVEKEVKEKERLAQSQQQRDNTDKAAGHESNSNAR